MNIKVAISIITYNQEKYIRDALENIVSQKTDFKFVACVCDDCSTDNTPKIIEEFAQKYPDIIKPMFREANVGSAVNYLENLSRCCNADYVAVCEGDDYWCDNYKLQKQVDFMEANPDYAICCHPAKLIYVDENKEPEIIGLSKHANPQSYYRMLKANNIPANSVMYRAQYLQKELENYPEDIYPPDWYTHISVAYHGKIGYLPDVMYVYRRHRQGISYTNSDNPAEEIYLKYGIKVVNFYFNVWNKIKDIFPQYYSEAFLPILFEVYFLYLKDKQFDKLEILQQNYGKFFKDMQVRYKEKFEISKRKTKRYRRLFNLFLVVSIILFLICVMLSFILCKSR